MDALTANGTTNIQTSVTGVTAGKRKFIDDRRDQPFDKRLRFSVRQTESAYRYRDIVVRKQDGFTHILLSTKSSENNSLNPEVRPIPWPIRASRFPTRPYPGPASNRCSLRPSCCALACPARRGTGVAAPRCRAFVLLAGSTWRGRLSGVRGAGACTRSETNPRVSPGKCRSPRRAFLTALHAAGG